MVMVNSEPFPLRGIATNSTSTPLLCIGAVIIFAGNTNRFHRFRMMSLRITYFIAGFTLMSFTIRTGSIIVKFIKRFEVVAGRTSLCGGHGFLLILFLCFSVMWSVVAPWLAATPALECSDR